MSIYFIGARCVGCGGCNSVCPAKCIDTKVFPFRIDEARCTCCGACFSACPLRAIKKDISASE